MLARALASAVLWLLALAPLTSQVAYDVYVDGVHPARILVAADERHGEYRYGEGPAEVLALEGGCDAGACKLVAVDSALALRFTFARDSLTGTLRLGDGRERLLVGTRRYDLNAPLVDHCGGASWLRSYGSVDDGYALALVRLPGRRLRGTLHVRSLATSFAASGEVDDAGDLIVRLARTDGTAAGRLDATPESDGSLVAGLSLDLGASRSAALPVRLAIADSLGLTCLQEGGTRDLTYPLTGSERADLELARRVRLWWSALTVEPAPAAPEEPETPGRHGEATGWFEPVRLDDQYLSGWQHLRLPDGRTESHAVTIDRQRGRLLRGSMALSGSRRERDAMRTAARRHAVDAHPLHDDDGFRAWAEGQTLAEFAVAEEGLAFGGEHHPVYGQLRWTEPWESLEPSRGLAALLPDWLRGWIGVPAERE